MSTVTEDCPSVASSCTGLPTPSSAEEREKQRRSIEHSSSRWMRDSGHTTSPERSRLLELLVAVAADGVDEKRSQMENSAAGFSRDLFHPPGTQIANTNTQHKMIDYDTFASWAVVRAKGAQVTTQLLQYPRAHISSTHIRTQGICCCRVSGSRERSFVVVVGQRVLTDRPRPPRHHLTNINNTHL